MNEDLISRDESIKEIYRLCASIPDVESAYQNGFKDGCRKAAYAVTKMTGVKLVQMNRVAYRPERISKLVASGETGYCPVCGHFLNCTFNYCYKCGTKIDWGNAYDPI